MSSTPPKPWKKLSSRAGTDHRIFSIVHELYVSPRTGGELDAVIVKAFDWVNVVAITVDQQCVLIRQYRFGTDEVTLEIPGGIIDDGETPLAAAQRELREETGYDGGHWTALGSIAPNPAFQRNRLYTFLAEGCRFAGPQDLDPGEDISVELCPYARIDELLASGAMDHALVAIAFQKVALMPKGVPAR